MLIVSAVDRVTGREAIAPGAAANLFQWHQDFPNLWDAWDIDRFYRNTGDVIVRVYGSRGRRATGCLVLDGLAGEPREVSLVEGELDAPRTGAELALGPFEVRTLRIAR